MPATALLFPAPVAIVAALFLAACGKPVADQPEPRADSEAAAALADHPADQTTPEQKSGLERAAADAGLPVTKQTRASFRCDNGETIEVRFFPDQGVAVLVRGGQNIELHREPTASGFQYSNGKTRIRGKGNDLLLDVGTTATTACVAA